MNRIIILCAALSLLLIFPAAAQGLYATGFEPPTYTAGESLSGVDGWTLVSGSASQAVIQYI